MKKSNLYIIGAGGFGREIESYLEKIPENEKDFNVVGFLDSSPEALNKYPSELKILGNPTNFEFSINDKCIIAIADCNTKEKLYFFLKEKVEIISFISPFSYVGNYVDIGPGSIICPNATITTNITMGICSTINLGSQIGHDVTIGNFTSIMANVDIGGSCTISEKVFIGSGATIIPKRNIESNAKIGAGSVVISKVYKNESVFGNPAKKILL